MSSNAIRFLEEKLGVTQTDEPRPALAGILQTRDYDSFEIRSDGGEILHVFQGPRIANRCLVGDHIYWDGTQCQLELRDEHPLLVGTIELTRSTRYGFTSRKTPLYLFTPYDIRYPPMIVGTNEKDKSRNRVGLVQFENWSESSMFPRGVLQIMLGVSGEMEVEKRAIIHLVCPWKYPKIPFDPKIISNPLRIPLTGYTFHVDPEGCRDVDDVLTIESIDDGLWKIVITISDVAAFVEDGSAVDIMASLISQTVYDKSGRVIHRMLPKEYSEGACSLVPGATHYGVSLQFLWDGQQMSDATWYESTVEVQRSYTYEAFQTESSAAQSVCKAIASYLAGEVLEDAHHWIEQFMIYYNKEAGKRLKEAGVGILRRHSEAEQTRMEYVRQYLSAEWKFLAMSSAEYVLSEEKDTYHSGLETDSYAHVSSPIRRYADLINQRALKWLIHSSEEERQHSLFIVPVATYTMNERERTIKQFGRDMEFLEAVESGKTKVKATIVEKKKRENTVDGSMEYYIRFYVPEWKKMISATYQWLDEDYIRSKDETARHFVPVGSEHILQCSVNWSSSLNWKKRLVIQLL